MRFSLFSGVCGLMALLSSPLFFAYGALAQTEEMAEALTGGKVTKAAMASKAAQAKKAHKAAHSRGVLSVHLKKAVDLDALYKTLIAQRRASASRYAAVDSLTPGSPYLAGNMRAPASGRYWGAADESRRNRVGEAELEIGMPLWLPGQRDAMQDNISASVFEVENRLNWRVLEVAKLVREAWWTAQRASGDLAIARDRLATARDIAQDMARRTQLGDSSEQDSLLAQSELLAAEAELAQSEGAAKAARAAYTVLTNAAPDGTLEPAQKGSLSIDDHPEIRSLRAGVLRAETALQLVKATPIDNPEVGIYGRREDVAQGNTRAGATTVGMRFRMALPSDGRNIPRHAEATAELIKAEAELFKAQRAVGAEVKAAALAVDYARKVDDAAQKRLTLANEQFDLARKSFRLGEINAFDLFRIKQLHLEAQRARNLAANDFGAAVSRLQQARGHAPGI